MALKMRFTTKQIVAAYRAANFVQAQTARDLGMTPQNLSHMRAKNDKLVIAMEEAKDELIDLAEHELHKLVAKGDIRAIKLFLEAKGRHKGYGQKMDITTSEKVDYTEDLEATRAALKRKHIDAS